MKSISLFGLCQKHHPCKKSLEPNTMPPSCLADEDGKCDEYKHALFCPKYGRPVGAIAKYGFYFIEEESE